jgi:hypothetical protein
VKSEKKSEKVLSRKKEGLSKAARGLLSRVRASPNPEAVYGLEPAAAEAKAWSVINPLVEDTGLPVARLNQYRWYLAELCRLMRTRSGPDLAYCMEFTIRKWLGFGLEPNSVVVLASELFDRLRPQPEPDKAEVRNQIPECRSADADGETAKDAKSAKASGVTPTPMEGSRSGEIPRQARNDSVRADNDERGTNNEPTCGGGGL